MSRKTTYTDEIGLAICSRLAEGESLRSICRDEGMPPLRTVFDWLESNETFRSRYARAREVQAEVLADELQEIADDGRNDWMERRNADGECVGWQENGEALRRSQLRIATRQWIASKLLPKKYGDRIQTEMSGSLEVRKPAAELTDDELAEIARKHAQP